MLPSSPRVVPAPARPAGKYTSWAGGIRVPAFVSGGFVPPAQRGTVQPGLIHIADWWATLTALAGVSDDDPVAAAAGLPPPDGLNMWPLLTGATETSPRSEVPLSPQSLISWPWKLQLGLQEFSSWTGQTYPNASSTDAAINYVIDCGDGSGPSSPGCLFNMEEDPTEHTDLAAVNPDIVSAMATRLSSLVPGFFSNNDTGVDVCPSGTLLCGCWAAQHVWGGFFGPFQY
jgi:arylsulfatase I/J